MNTPHMYGTKEHRADLASGTPAYWMYALPCLEYLEDSLSSIAGGGAQQPLWRGGYRH